MSSEANATMLYALLAKKYRELEVALGVKMGTPGPIGPQGVSGERGAIGESGPIGPIGPEGPQGSIGTPGPVGPMGPQGFTGTQGERGFQGIAGPEGKPGRDGKQGPQGLRGLVGATGGVGKRGARGEKGDTGAPGLKWRGPFTFGVKYKPNDVVQFEGSSYVAKFETTLAPTYQLDWDLVAKKGDDGLSLPSTIINQSSEGVGALVLGDHPNGLYLVEQALNLALATAEAAGAMSAEDKIKLDSLVFVSAFANGAGLIGSAEDPDNTRLQAGLDECDELLHPGSPKTFRMPQGEYWLDLAFRDDSGRVLRVPNGVRLLGDGRGRTVIHLINSTTGIGQNGVNAIQSEDGSSNIFWKGLHLIGENGIDEASFTYSRENQNSALSVESGVNSRWVELEDCHFEFLYGFSFHDAGNNRHVSVKNCTFHCTSNGLNGNADWSIFTNNVFDLAEGIEASGMHIVVVSNTMRQILGNAFSIGGNQDGNEWPGAIVANNSVDGSTALGMTLTDGCVCATITGNVIRGCKLGGLVAALADPSFPLHSCVFSGNVIDSNCQSGGANIVGCDIGQGAGKHLFYANQFIDRAIPGYSQAIGLLIRVPNCVVSGNRFRGPFKDCSFVNATNTQEENNIFENRNEEWIGTSSRTPKRISVPDVDAYLEIVRFWGGSPGDDYGLFARTPKGKFLWGNGQGYVYDTTLERKANDLGDPSAGGHLYTNEKFCAQKGFGTGNSASATTLGSVVKKMEVFDASGASLGFVPIYDTIT